jgi:gliding motility-associated-like protein
MFKTLRTILKQLSIGDVGMALSFLKKTTLFVFMSLLFMQRSYGANETLNTGAFIINMGVTPQTVANGLKPYGLLYDIIKNNDAQVKWVISQTKIKDGIDFTYNSIAYRGGTFIIPVEFRTAAVNARIAAWQAKGVVGVTTTTPLTVDVTVTLKIAPYWAMDAQNGLVAIKFLQAAEIPATAYYYRTPATLGTCDDLFIMPHADPEWLTHGNLYFWNKNSKGGIWAGCHAVSVMEGPDCVNPSNPAQNLKFLSTGGLVDFGDHQDGTVPYSYSNVSDPVFQMMGSEDAAHKNGSEQIYLPLKIGSTWNTGTKIGTYDPTHNDIPVKSNGAAAVVLYGRGFNDPTRGYVMYEGGHDIGGTTAPEVSAQRQFFNFCFTVATDKAPYGVLSNIPASVNGGVLYPNFTITPFSPSGLTTFTYQWSTTVGGTFSAPTSAVTNYTPPILPYGTPIVVTCRLRDACGRTTTESKFITCYPAPAAPVAQNDTILFANLCAAQTTTTYNVLANDTDANHDMLSNITFMGGGNYGTFTNLGNGNVSYTPAWNFLGTDTMRYRICDTLGLCSFATIVVKTSFSGNCTIWQFQRADSVRADLVTSVVSVSNPDSILGSADQANGASADAAKFSSYIDSIVVRLDSMLYTGDTLKVRMASDNATCAYVLVQGSMSPTSWPPGVNEDTLFIPNGTSKIYNDYLFTTNSSIKYIRIKIWSNSCDNKVDIDNVRAYPRQCLDGRPTANVDNITTGQNSAITTNVKINDSDLRNQSLTVSIQSNPSHGTAGINGAGNIVYTPAASYYGSDQFVYRATNTSCLSDTAIVYVNVTQNPCADTLVGTYHSGNVATVVSTRNVTNPNFITGIPDAINGNNNNTAEIGGAINDSIVINLGDTVPTGDTIVIRMGSDNASGAPITVEGNLVQNAFGSPTSSAVFNIPAAQNKQWANYNFIVTGPTRYIKIRQTAGIMKVDIDAMSWNFWKCAAGPNNPPVAFDDTSSTFSNRPVLTNVQANDQDPDGNSFTTSVISSTNGTTSIVANKILYTPSFGFTGTTTITYKICDNGTPSMCDTAILTVTVRPGPPVAITNNSSVSSNSNVTVNVQANDTLSVSAYIYTTSLYPTILSPSNGTAVLIGNNIKYTPNANFNGRDSLCYMLCDNGSTQQCDTAILYITVNNQAPLLTNDAATTSACNNATINALANDVDPESQGLTITSVTVPTSGTAVISNNQILYTPSSSPVFTGVATFQYTACDSGYIAQCQTATVNVTVNMVFPPSNPPVAVDDVDSTYIGQLLYMQLSDNDTDPDNDSLRIDTVSAGLLAPTLGTLSYIGNIVLYTPQPGQVGVDSFEYRVCDIQHFGGGCVNIVSSCSVAMVRMVIQNHAPYAADDYYGTTPTTTFSGNVSTNDVESDGENMTFTQLTGPSHATSWIFNNDGTFTYQPNGIFQGVDTASYIVCDGLLCDTGLIIITVQVANLAPIAANDTVNITTVLPHNGDVSLNDIDPNGNIDPNSFAVTGGPNTGTFVFNNNGTFTFTAAPGFIGYEYVTYQVCDLSTPSLCGGATLVIAILDAAPATFNENDTINEDSGTLNVTAGNGILSNGDFDPNGTAITIDTVPMVNAAYGVEVVHADGSYSYTPNADFNGTDFFIVNICDSTNNCTPDTVFIVVNPVNDPVTIVNDLAAGNEDTPFAGIIITGGDFDPDTTTLVVNTTPVSGPAHGGIVIDNAGNYTYTPDADFNGTDTVVINVCDGGNPLPATCANDTLIFTVTAVNDPPVMTNENISTNEDTPFSNNAISNDNDPDSTALTVNTTPVVNASNGGFVIAANGNYTYTPNANFNGTDMVVVNVCDAGTPLPIACVNDTIFITVNPVNDAVTIVNDTKTTNEDTPVGGTIITAGDFDTDTTALTVNTTPVSGPTNGGFVINAAGNYTYTPDAGFNGVDTIILNVCDAGTPMPATCANDTLIITVNAVNDPPVITSETISTNEDTPFSNNAISNDSDPDTTSLSANTTAVSGPSNGGFVIAANGNYTYTPNANFNGTDMVVISVCDAGNPMPAACVNDTIFITVDPVNDDITIVNDNNFTNEDTPLNGGILTAGDFDTDTTALTVNTTPVSGPANGGFVINAAGNYTYTPDAGFNGVDTIILNVCDAGTPMPATCANDTLIITVNAVNDAPVMTNENISTNEDTPFSNNAISNDSDPDSTSLTANTTPVVDASNGTFVIAANGDYTYTPNADFNGTDMVVIDVCDAGNPLPASCVNDTIFITVNPVNDTIILANDVNTTNEDTPVGGNILTAGDYDIDTTTLVVNTTPVSGPSNGGFVIDNLGNYTYTPNAGFNGTDIIILNVCDSGTPLPATCDNDTLVITVNAVNDAPVTVTQSFSTNEDTPFSGNAITNDSDPDSTGLSANTTPLSGPSNGIFSIAGDGSYTYTPNTDFNGIDMVIISVCDSGNPMPPACTNDTIFITVDPVNDAIILANDVNTTNEETPVGGNILTAGDYDIDTTTLVVNTTPVSGPSNGGFIIDNLGNYTYTPNAGFNGTDIIILNVCDSGTPLPATCDNDTLVITVNAVNDTPVLANDTAEVDEDDVVTGTVLNGFDSDPDSTMLTADTIPVSGPSHGSIQINPDGTYTYTPDPDYNGSDEVIISICDGGNPLPAICVNDTLSITVHPINDPPVIVNDINNTNEDNAVGGNILTAGDFDPDTTSLTVNTTVVSGPANGIFVIDAAGNYTYTPNTDFNGTETIVISVCDAGTPLPIECVNDTLVITVNPVNDQLIIINDTISTNEGVAIAGTILTAGDYDPDSTVLAANPFIITGPFHGTILVNANGTYNYTPDPFYNGADTIVIQVCDGGTPLPVTCDNDTLFVTVNAANNAPVISNDAITINEDTPVSGSILSGTDFDPDTTSLTVTTTPVSGPLHGNIVIQTDGSYNYTPYANYFGIDTVIIAVCDSGNPLPAICINDTLIITINPVNDNPVVANENTNTCAGSPLQVSVLSNDSDIDGDSIIVTSVNQPSNGLATTDGITVTYTPATGFIGIDSLLYTVCDNGSPVRCSNAMIYFDVHGIASIGIAATDALCKNDSSGSVTTNPVGVAPFTYAWSNGATTQNITNVPAGLYTVTVTDSLGCSTASSATVNQPATSVQANASATDASCFGGSNGTATVNANGGTGAYTYLWSNTDTTQSISGLIANTYSVTVTDANGCAATVSSVVVSQPSAPVSITGTTIPSNCLNGTNGSVDITTSGGTPGYSFNWSNSAVTEDISDIAGSYFITATDLNGCTDTATFTILDASTVTISATGGANTICLGDSVMLSSSATGGTFQWNYNGAPIAGGSNSTYYASLAGSYTLDQTNACGSFTSSTLVIVTTALPVINVTGNMMICEGTSTQFTATGATNYSWSPATDLDNPASAIPIANPVVTTTYTVTGTVGSCSGTTTATLVVNPTPALVVTQTPHDCRFGTQITATGANGYMWSPPNGLDQINIPNPVARPYETTTYTVTASSSNSCIATATVTVIVDCDDVKIPSGFSPDGDGVNDKFVIEDIDFFESPNLIVFNRWGNIVFSMDDYDNSWDGTNKSNNFSLGDGKVPDGTYFYVLQLNPTLVKTGYIVIKY